jgi:hypothetical protein
MISEVRSTADSTGHHIVGIVPDNRDTSLRVFRIMGEWLHHEAVTSAVVAS